MNNDILEDKDIKNKNKEIFLKIALTLNKELYEEKVISYKIFKYTEENILKKLNTLERR